MPANPQSNSVPQRRSVRARQPLSLRSVGLNASAQATTTALGLTRSEFNYFRGNPQLIESQPYEEELRDMPRRVELALLHRALPTPSTPAAAAAMAAQQFQRHSLNADETMSSWASLPRLASESLLLPPVYSTTPRPSDFTDDVEPEEDVEEEEEEEEEESAESSSSEYDDDDEGDNDDGDAANFQIPRKWAEVPLIEEELDWGTVPEVAFNFGVENSVTEGLSPRHAEQQQLVTQYEMNSSQPESKDALSCTSASASKPDIDGNCATEEDLQQRQQQQHASERKEETFRFTTPLPPSGHQRTFVKGLFGTARQRQQQGRPSPPAAGKPPRSTIPTRRSTAASSRLDSEATSTEQQQPISVDELIQRLERELDRQLIAPRIVVPQFAPAPPSGAISPVSESTRVASPPPQAADQVPQDSPRKHHPIRRPPQLAIKVRRPLPTQWMHLQLRTGVRRRHELQREEKKKVRQVFLQIASNP